MANSGFNQGQTGKATEVGAGVVKLATQAQIDNGDASDGGVPLVVTPDKIAGEIAKVQSIDMPFQASEAITEGRMVRIGPVTDEQLSTYYTAPEGVSFIQYEQTESTAIFRQSFTIDTSGSFRLSVEGIKPDWEGRTASSSSSSSWRGFFRYTIYQAGASGGVGAVVIATQDTATNYWRAFGLRDIVLPLTGLADGDYVLEIQGVRVSGTDSQDQPRVWYKNTAAVPSEPWNEFLTSTDGGATFTPVVAGNSVGEYRVLYKTNPTVAQGTSIVTTATRLREFLGIAKNSAATKEQVIVAVVGLVNVEQDVVPGTNYIFDGDGLLVARTGEASVQGITGKTVLITQAGAFS